MSLLRRVERLEQRNKNNNKVYVYESQLIFDSLLNADSKARFKAIIRNHRNHADNATVIIYDDLCNVDISGYFPDEPNTKVIQNINHCIDSFIHAAIFNMFNGHYIEDNKIMRIILKGLYNSIQDIKQAGVNNESSTTNQIKEHIADDGQRGQGQIICNPETSNQEGNAITG